MKIEYVLSDPIELIAKIERKSLPKISDHQMLIIRSKSRETWASMNRPNRDTREELNFIAQVKFAQLDESEICRYNSLFASGLRHRKKEASFI